MKAPTAKNAKTPQTAVFQKTLHQIRTRGEKSATNPKPQKRDNVFSQSRDTREDRSARQMKMSHNSQTFSHPH
jgi:hypothetical protein